MKIFGFLLILQLFEDHYKSLFDKIENYSIEVKQVGELVQALITSNNTDEFDFTNDDVRQPNFVIKQTVAKYYSKSLRDYIIYHNISSEAEGFVVTLHTLKNFPIPSGSDKKNQTYPPTVIFVPNQGFDVTQINKRNLSSTISVYVDKVRNNLDYNEIAVLKDNNNKNILKVGNLNTLTVEPITKSEIVILEKLSKRIVNVEKFKEVRSDGINNNTSIVNNTLVYSEESRSTKDINEASNNETNSKIINKHVNENDVPKTLSKFNAKVMKMYKSTNDKPSQNFNKTLLSITKSKLDTNKQNETYTFRKKQHEVLDHDKGNMSSFNNDKKEKHGVPILKSFGNINKSVNNIINETTAEKTLNGSSYDDILKINASTNIVSSIQEQNKVSLHIPENITRNKQIELKLFNKDKKYNTEITSILSSSENGNKFRNTAVTEIINLDDNEAVKIYTTASVIPSSHFDTRFTMMSDLKTNITNNRFKIKPEKNKITSQITETIVSDIKEKTESIAPALTNEITNSNFTSIPNLNIQHEDVKIPKELYKFNINTSITDILMPSTKETHFLKDDIKANSRVKSISHSIGLINSPLNYYTSNKTDITKLNIYDIKRMQMYKITDEKQSKDLNKTIDSFVSSKSKPFSNIAQNVKEQNVYKINVSEKTVAWPIYKDQQVENSTHMVLNKYAANKTVTEKINSSDNNERELLINKGLSFISPIKAKVNISEVAKVNFHRKYEKNTGLHDTKKIETENFGALKDEKKTNIHGLKIIKLHRNNTKGVVFDSEKPAKLNNDKILDNTKEKNTKGIISKTGNEQLKKTEIHNGKILKLYRKINKSLPFITQKRKNYDPKTELDFKQNTDFYDELYKNLDYSLEEDNKSEEQPKFNLHTAKIL